MSAILEISTVVGCRMRCSYCPQSTLGRAYGGADRQMTLETFKACVDKVPKDVAIYFAGMAEPWQNPAATDMLLYAAETGHPVSVFTTLAGMSLADVARIRNLPFKHFCIHLPDSAGKMHFNVTDTYLDVLRACLRIKAYTPMVIGLLHPAVEAVTGPVNDGTPAVISRAGNLPELAIQRKTGKLMCSACGPKIDHNVLMPNGDVALCCMTYDLKNKLGSLLTGSYEGLFTGEAYQAVMRGLAGDESIDIACRTCEVSVPV